MTSEIKSRKPSTTHSPEQRQEILALCRQPNASIAEIARKYDIHHNTIYKWMAKEKNNRLEPSSGEQKAQSDFISIPVSLASNHIHQISQNIRIEISTPLQQSIVIEWPLESIAELSIFIRGLSQ